MFVCFGFMAYYGTFVGYLMPNPFLYKLTSISDNSVKQKYAV